MRLIRRKEADSAVCCLSCHRRVVWNPHVPSVAMLPAGRGRPAGTPFGSLVRALPVVVAARGAAFCLSLVGTRIWWQVGGTRDVPVEALFPEGRKRFELGSSGWSRVIGIDAVGGAPHCNFADEGGAGMASRWCPGWRSATLAGVILNLVGDVGDKLGSLGQIGPPDRIGVQRFWNAGKPRQRTRVDGRGAVSRQ
jgi:hypothetical protein